MTDKNPTMLRRVSLDSPDETRELAARLADTLDSGGTIAFRGGLGSGKTTFIQGIAAALGCRGLVNSPTYTIINRYDGGRLTLVHVDCYRIRCEDELWDIGLAEMFAPDTLVCVEWSEKAGGILPADRLKITLEAAGGDRRTATLEILGSPWPRLGKLFDQIDEER